MKQYLSELYNELSFPPEASAALLTAYDRLSASREASRILTRYLLIYTHRDLFDEWGELDGELGLAAKYAELPPYTVHLLFVSLLTPELKRRYRKAGHPEALFWHSMQDLRYKMIECEQLYGVWGISTLPWMRYWFHLRRFAFGRLQFELMTLDRVVSVDGITLERGDKVINTHIPSGGKLSHDDVVASYREAAEFFRPMLDGKPPVFHCYSWLLFPKHSEILPPHSNIRKFAEDYKLFDWGDDEKKHDLWRIFYKDADKPPHELPRTNTLERAYADLLLRGELPGWGSGILSPDWL